MNLHTEMRKEGAECPLLRVMKNFPRFFFPLILRSSRSSSLNTDFGAGDRGNKTID